MLKNKIRMLNHLNNKIKFLQKIPLYNLLFKYLFKKIRDQQGPPFKGYSYSNDIIIIKISPTFSLNIHLKKIRLNVADKSSRTRSYVLKIFN